MKSQQPLQPFQALVTLRGRIRISSIDYNLHSLALDANSDGDYDDANDIKPDIPEWFVRNKWYQYVYVAYSNGEIPGATPICTAEVDCPRINSEYFDKK